MRERRLGTLVIVAGGIGLLAGSMLLARFPASDTFGDARRPVPWTRDDGLRFALVMNLVLLGVAVWHLVRFRLEKLVVIGLLAIGAPFHLTDPGSGPQAWEQGYEGDELIGMWLFAASVVVVLVGVLWSSIAERPADSKTLWSYLFGGGAGGPNVEPVRQGIVLEEWQSAPEGWWRAADGKWYSPEQRAGSVPPPPGPEPTRASWWTLGWVWAAAFAVLLFVGFAFFRDTGHDVAEPVGEIAEDETDDRGRLRDEEWTIDVDGDRPGVHIVTMVRTFDMVDGPDEEGVGGRLVWPEIETDVCSAEVGFVGDGVVQVAAFFPTEEECGPEMGQAFDDFGLPDTACLFVVSEGVENEYCAPLAVD